MRRQLPIAKCNELYILSSKKPSINFDTYLTHLINQFNLNRNSLSHILHLGYHLFNFIPTQSWPNKHFRLTQFTTFDFTDVSEDIAAHDRQRRAVASPDEHDFTLEHTYTSAKTIYKSTKANHILHYFSVAILAAFVVEVILKLIGYGKYFFSNKMEVGVIIVWVFI